MGIFSLILDFQEPRPRSYARHVHKNLCNEFEMHFEAIKEIYFCSYHVLPAGVIGP